MQYLLKCRHKGMDCRSSDQWDRAKLGATFKTFLPEIDTIRIVEKRQFRG